MDAKTIVDTMMSKDEFSQWLGIKVLAVKQGYVKLELSVRKEMCNGFGIAHGGISFSLADSALAFASNTLGRHAVSTEVSISHLAAINTGDILIAESKEISRGHRIAVYSIAITNQKEELVAHFKGNVYRKAKEWE